MKKEYCVGIKIINCFYVEAESEKEAEEIVREYDPYKTLDDCDFNIEYADLTNGEIAWKLKQEDLYVKDGDYSIHVKNKSNE